MRFTRTARTIRAAAIVAASLAVVATSALSAQADAPFTPDADDVVLVGSDTTELLLNDLANLYNGRTPTPTRRLASWDATGSATITPRAGAASITRPNGSGAGVAELCKTGTAVDSARSSSGPATPAPCADLKYLKYAEDHLRWMANTGVTGVTSLTDAQLKGIYNCTITNWSQVGGPNATIVPLIPQINSGTRKTWAAMVGISSTTLPSCVSDQNGTVQEHDAAPVRATANSIAPVSEGRYGLLTAAQKSGTFLGTIPAADQSKYNRNLYQVVKAPGGVVPAYLADLFGDGTGLSSTGTIPFICEPADPSTTPKEAGDLIASNGFFQLPLGTCGTFG
jgi:ABC-type phosphate transport system substrate-binding protein